jgi:hypothetical protein
LEQSRPSRTPSAAQELGVEAERPVLLGEPLVPTKRADPVPTPEAWKFAVPKADDALSRS